jgi:hypothetical protein
MATTITHIKNLPVDLMKALLTKLGDPIIKTDVDMVWRPDYFTTELRVRVRFRLPSGADKTLAHESLLDDGLDNRQLEKLLDSVYEQVTEGVWKALEE